MKVKAYAAQNATSPLAPYEFERRAVGDKDVQIQILYCGICHSDIHTARNEWHGTIYPCVPGHEIVGKVTAVGKTVSKYKVGDQVGVGCLVNSCRYCGSCKEGLQNYCDNGFTLTYNSASADPTKHTMGGYSSHIVVDQDFVLTIPQGMDLAATAPLLCAGITTYSPLKHVGVGKGDRVAVLGLGGLGHMGVKLAAAMGAEVTVLSRSPQKAEDAKRLGAAHFALTTDDTQMTKMAAHFDYILDTVAAKHDVNQALNCIKRDGTLIMVGAADKPLDLAVFSLIFKRRQIMGSLIGGIPQTQEMLNFCAKHNIVSDIELINPTQINEAYERTVSGRVKYRFVIDNQKL